MNYGISAQLKWTCHKEVTSAHYRYVIQVEKAIDSQYIVNCGQTIKQAKPLTEASRSKEHELNSTRYSKVNLNAITLSIN